MYTWNVTYFGVLLYYLTRLYGVLGHARLMEPPSRASMWRLGFSNPSDFNDNQGYCGGFLHQYGKVGGKCGICGDPWDAKPRQHESPGGAFANGLITRSYRPGQTIPIEIDVTANHFGFFTFRLCPNNNTSEDPTQSCFDKLPLPVMPGNEDHFVLPTQETGTFSLNIRLPIDLWCKQCILQWTYTCGNNWGVCTDGSGGLGCGPQEMFRACSDITITGKPVNSSTGSYSYKDRLDISSRPSNYNYIKDNSQNIVNVTFFTAPQKEIATKKIVSDYPSINKVSEQEVVKELKDQTGSKKKIGGIRTVFVKKIKHQEKKILANKSEKGGKRKKRKGTATTITKKRLPTKIYETKSKSKLLNRFTENYHDNGRIGYIKFVRDDNVQMYFG